MRFLCSVAYVHAEGSPERRKRARRNAWSVSQEGGLRNAGVKAGVRSEEVLEAQCSINT